MTIKKEKSKEDLKEIILNDDSSLILPEVSFPTTYQAQSGVKYGAKSNEYRLASEHDLLEYQKRISRRDSTLTSEEIRILVSETESRRQMLEQSIAEQKEQFHQRRTIELEERYAKDREESRANRIAHENDSQRRDREHLEEETKVQRAKQIQALENKCRKEKEDLL